MGRSSASERVGQQLHLEIKGAPSFFRCPISLEVMRSPVSLCTGVTYDRSSIQRWLDSGHTTCPATMLPLPSTDLVPNLTLRRLIHIWDHNHPVNANDNVNKRDAELVRDIASDPLPALRRLALFFADPDVEDEIKNRAVNADDFANVVSSIAKGGSKESKLEQTEAAMEVVSLILNSDWIQGKNREILITALLSDLDAITASLLAVLKDGCRLESRLDSVLILQAILSAPGESVTLSPEKVDAFIPELIRLVTSPMVTDVALGCLEQMLSSKRALKTMVQFELVPALVRILSPKAGIITAKVAERAIVILEAAANCSAGRTGINEMVEECVEAVMGRMMKAGKGGREAAVGMLWSVCYGSGGGDRRAKEAVGAVGGGMAKILVVMQGDCSPAVRRMAADLLRVFRVDAKSLVAGYDTKTTHIMPF